MQLLGIAEKIVRIALNKKAEQSEVFIMKSKGTSLSIEKNSLGFSSSGEDFGIGIRVVKDNGIGFSYCTDISKAEKSIEQALKSSKLTKVKNYEFPYPQKTKKIKNLFDKKIIDFSVEDCLDNIKTIIESAKEVNKDIIISNGGISYGEICNAIANSNKLAMEEKGTGIVCNAITVLKKKTISTGFEFSFSRTFNSKFEEIGRNAGEMALNAQNPKSSEQKSQAVIFTPYALGAIMEFATVPTFYGDSANKGESVYSNKIGKEVCSENLTLIDDATYEGGLCSSSFDDEGEPSKKTILVEDGILKNFLYDNLKAKEYNSEPTSNAVRCERFSTSRTYKALPSIKSRNFIIHGKTTKYEELIKDTKEGILVYDILGAHTVNPASGDFSVNSSIVFKIKKGEIAYPLKPIMLSGNFPNCLKNVSQIGNDFKILGGSLSTVSFVIPSLKIENVKIT